MTKLDKGGLIILTLMALGFIENKADSNLCFKVEGKILVMFPLYVDDLFLIGTKELIKDARRRLAIDFKLKDLGMMHYFLGMEVSRVHMESPLDKGSMQWRS